MFKPGGPAALICHVDMLASFAALTGQKLAEADGPDSINVLPALLGEKSKSPAASFWSNRITWATRWPCAKAPGS